MDELRKKMDSVTALLDSRKGSYMRSEGHDIS